MRKRMTPELLKDAVELYERGWLWTEIADYLNVRDVTCADRIIESLFKASYQEGLKAEAREEIKAARRWNRRWHQQH